MIAKVTIALKTVLLTCIAFLNIAALGAEPAITFITRVECLNTILAEFIITTVTRAYSRTVHPIKVAIKAKAFLTTSSTAHGALVTTA